MRPPTLHLLRTRYPDLAGVLLRDWHRAGCAIRYVYHPQQGFYLLGLRPRWPWLLGLIWWGLTWPTRPHVSRRTREQGGAR